METFLRFFNGKGRPIFATMKRIMPKVRVVFPYLCRGNPYGRSLGVWEFGSLDITYVYHGPSPP